MDLVEVKNQNTTDVITKKSKGFLHLLLRKSTLPPLVQIHSTGHLTTKIFWCLLLFSGLVMSLHQSCALIKAYLRYSVNEKESVVLKVPLPIPAVTLCSNTLINWNSEDAKEAVNISGILKSMNVTDVNEMDFDQSEMAQDVIILKLTEFNETQRINLGINVTNFLEYYIYDNGDILDRDMMTMASTNLFYGNCVTLDANMHYNHSFKSKWEGGYYYFVVHVQNASSITNWYRHKSIVGTIHQSGTPPIMKLENIFQVYPGEYMEIRIAQTEINRLPWPYESECVQDDSSPEQWKSLYHSEKKPFLYTMEACRDSCLQNLSYTYCNCINPMLGTRSKLPKLKELCYYGCNKIPPQEIVEMCGCRASCRYLEFTFQEKRNPNALKQPMFQTQLMNTLKRLYPEHNRQQRATFMENLGFLHVSTTSNFVRVVQEEAAITGADLGGAIGGVFGLWIGLSAMSLFEVFVAFQISFLSYLKRIRCQWRRKTNDLSEPQPK